MTESNNAFKPEYPAPPQVHWAVLLAITVVFVILDFWLIPKTLRGHIGFTIFYAWIFYLSFWIRKINPNSNCLFWAILCFILSVIGKLLPSQVIIPWDILAAFVIRDELLEQYNEREPIHLRLSPAMTFFFSFFYLQYHLYKIAVAKKQQQTNPDLEPNSDYHS